MDVPFCVAIRTIFVDKARPIRCALYFRGRQADLIKLVVAFENTNKFNSLNGTRDRPPRQRHIAGFRRE
jgi:hypothetical protein